MEQGTGHTAAFVDTCPLYARLVMSSVCVQIGLISSVQIARASVGRRSVTRRSGQGAKFLTGCRPGIVSNHAPKHWGFRLDKLATWISRNETYGVAIKPCELLEKVVLINIASRSIRRWAYG